MEKMVMEIDQERNAAEGEVDDLQDEFDLQAEQMSELY